MTEVRAEIAFLSGLTHLRGLAVRFQAFMFASSWIIVFEASAISGRRLRQGFPQSNADAHSHGRATRHPVYQGAKILSTRLMSIFEGGNIDSIVTSPDKFVRRTNQATFPVCANPACIKLLASS